MSDIEDARREKSIAHLTRIAARLVHDSHDDYLSYVFWYKELYGSYPDIEADVEKAVREGWDPYDYD